MKERIVKSKGNEYSILLDDEDFEHLSHKTINISWPSGMPYATVSHSGDKNKFLHRVIMKATHGKCIDHKNGNTLDNTKSNLRECTQSENVKNQRIKSTNKTGYKGVSIYKAYTKYGKQFAAEITVNYKRISLGYFSSPEQAAMAYNEAAVKYHGEFAKLNQIPCVA